jgi:hypothetical protein
MDSLANGMLEIRVISSNGDLPGISRVDHGLLKEPMITELLSKWRDIRESSLEARSMMLS